MGALRYTDSFWKDKSRKPYAVKNCDRSADFGSIPGQTIASIGGNRMIVTVDQSNLEKAAIIHSVSWQESHRSFCSPEFIALHTTQHQKEYLRQKIDRGSRVFMLIEDRPIGVVSVTGSLIEDLYILPDVQNHGYGTFLLRYAIGQCDGIPTLWILENNKGAEKLYRREGFRETGRKNAITDKLDEIEFSLSASRSR